MATYLLDTTVIIDAINGKRGRNASLIELAEAGHMLACCPVNVAEVYAGMRPKEERKTADLLHSLRLLPITFEIAERAGRFRRAYAQKGVNLAIPDVIIAAVAVENGLALITDNAKDFPMPELVRHSLARG
jgi:predicted nucleic acid-binding protein